MILAPVGMVFFARHATAGTTEMAWQGPWITAVAASMAGLWCTPFYAFIEGCGQVRAVASMRFRQAIATSVFAWLPMLAHRGLYSPTLAIMGYVGAGVLFMATRRRLLVGLLRHPVRASAFEWSREVLPFQWRIAVSWMCSYFTVQVFIPIVFSLRGAVEAGQIGMSISITAYMTVLALAWTSPKATPFGHLIARRQFETLDRLFLRTLAQSLSVFATIALGACGVAVLLSAKAPQLAARMVSPQLFAVLVVAAGANCVVQNLGTLLRCFKREPFLIQSLVVASLTLTVATLTAARWGNAGAALSYLAATAGVGLPVAWVIFCRERRGYRTIVTLAVCECDSR
jgi:hypothetical protein